MALWYIAIPIFLLAIFLVSYKINRTSLIPSVIFTLFLFSLLAVITAFIISHGPNPILRALFVLIWLPFGLIAVFGIYTLIAFLFLNARAVLKKERRTLAHYLTLILAIGLVLYLIATHIIQAADISQWPIAAQAVIQIVNSWVGWMALFYSIHFTQYIVATALCNLSRPRKNQDYIIVHGSGLKGKNVSFLLSQRIDKAINFYNKQKKITTPPKLIMSGGQGQDELRTEAKAMADYAIAKGIPKSHILTESKSTTTLENMRFSKQIMDKNAKGRPYHAIYVTSGYHLLRTGMYARMAGLKISGIGARTAFYYIPVALLREYIAYIVMHKKRNTTFAVLSFLASCATTLVTFYFT